MNPPSPLNIFFNPKGVAIIGVSQDPTKLGYGLANNLRTSGYRGEIHFVNHKGGTLLGETLYRSILDVPDPVDNAVVLIPAPYVPDLMDEIGQRGIRSVVIGSGGFREIGETGEALEKQTLEAAKKWGIRIIGPNCVGIIDTHVPINATFLPPPGPDAGDVAFLSQSGAICAAAIDWSRGHGYGISRLVSLGNQVDISETDLLVPTAADEQTRVIALYLEGIKAGRTFITEARKVIEDTPLIALKVGKFESGKKAAASHTGALAGRDSAYQAAFRRAGVLRAQTTEEMFDQARALAWCPLPTGNQVAILTNAGGPGVTAADALEERGLGLAPLLPATQEKLGALLPAASSLHNPVDLLASSTPEQFAGCLEILLEDPGVDSVMVIYPTPPMSTAGAVAKALIPVIQQAEKPVVVSVMGDRLIQEAVEHLRAARIPEYRFPERAAAALHALVNRVDLLKYSTADELISDQVNPSLVKEILAKADPDRPLDALQSQQILEAYGIPTGEMGLARNPDRACELAANFGKPVALKVASSHISHKTDIGGVVLNLEGEDAIRSSFEKITRKARQANPEADIEGVFVQEMHPRGQEVIIGSIQDPQFGAMLMFGSGGTDVEGLQDTAFCLAPATEPEIEALLQETWGGRKLAGYRNLPPADQEAVRETIIRLGQLAADFPELDEIEINPLLVFKDGEGAAAVDARISRIQKPT